MLARGNLGFIPAWQFGINAGPGGPDLRGLSLSDVMPPADPVDVLNNVFSSWGWRHRKAIILGGGAALALGVIGGLAAILK